MEDYIRHMYKLTKNTDGGENSCCYSFYTAGLDIIPQVDYDSIQVEYESALEEVFVSC